jgi:hypothetical protein
MIYLFKHLTLQEKSYIIKADSMDQAANILARHIGKWYGPWRWDKITAAVIDKTYKFYNVLRYKEVHYFIVKELDLLKPIIEI